MYEQYSEFARAAGDAGVLAGGEELGPTASATTVRLRDGRQLVTDGPYAEAKEALGGYFILDCESLDDGARVGGPDPGRVPRRGRGASGPRRRGGLTVKYALLVYSDQSDWDGISEEEAAERRAESMPRWITLFEEMGKADPDVEGRSSWRPPRRRSCASWTARRVITDGPFAETKEQIGGLFLTDLPDLDEAIRIASLVPAAEYGSLEVRPIVER